MSEKIALSEMLEQLRHELTLAKAEGEDATIRFGVEEVTLEAKVTVTKEAGAEAKAKFWVFTEAGVSGKVGASHVQTITLKLRPVDENGDFLELSR
jgi:hypothetical protein